MQSTEEERVKELNSNESQEEECQPQEKRISCSAMAHAVGVAKLFSSITEEDKKIIYARQKQVQDEKEMVLAAEQVVEEEKKKLKVEEIVIEPFVSRNKMTKQKTQVEAKEKEKEQDKKKEGFQNMLGKVGMFALLKRVDNDEMEDIYD